MPDPNQCYTYCAVECIAGIILINTV